MTEEELQELELYVQQIMGKGWDSLTDDQKKAVYTDYAGRRATLANQRGDAQGLIDTPTPEGIQAGNVYVASNPLAHIGKAIGQYRGRQQQKKIDAEEGELSEQYGVGAAAAGKVADEQQQGMMKLYAMIMRDQQKKAAQGAPSAAAKPANPQMPPMQSAANPPAPPPMLARPQPAQLPSGGTVPGNPQEWQAYMMRARQQTPPPGPDLEDDEEEQQNRWLSLLGRSRNMGGGY